MNNKDILMALQNCYRKYVFAAITLSSSLMPSNIHTHAGSLGEPKISVSQLQERQVRALKQIDLSESILDTLGQSIASGASKLSSKKKTEVQFKLQTLRKEMSIIKDASAVHINKKQLFGLINLNAELIRVLTGAVNSGLEIVPNFDEAKLKKRSAEEPSLTKIDLLLNRNQKKLTALTQLSEQVGLNQLNHIYRTTRKLYKKYYIWPIIEHITVYTFFLNWVIMVTGKDIWEELAKRDGFLGKMGHYAYEQRCWLGGTSGIKNTHLGSEYRVAYMDKEGFLSNASKHDLPIAIKKNADSDPEPLNIDSEKYSEQQRENIKASAAALRTSEPQQVMSAERDIVGRRPGGGVVDETIAPTSGVFDWGIKGYLVQIPVASFFGSYIAEDFKQISKHTSRYTNIIDDWLYGTTKKRTYDSVTTPDQRFSTIVGRDDIKAELMKVVEYVCSPDKFDRAGIKIERGYLLAGVPQTGKTLTAKALSGEISAALAEAGKDQKMRLFEISTENLIKKGIQYYMDLARYHAPCILFLDELDLLRLQRDGDSKLLSEFLTAMSGTLSKDEKSHIIIMAATNKPENLDFALRQHGRFGKMFWFDNPTHNNRISFFKQECEKRCMDSSRFDFKEIAQQTEGCSYGTLDMVMKDGLMLAKRNGTSVMQHHFEEAIDNVVKNLIPRGYDVPAEKEEIIAVHQTGKALMSILLEPKKQLSKVTVLPIVQHLEEEHVTQQYNIAGLQSKDQRAIRYGGIFSYHWEDSLNLESQDELKKQCKILLAGNIAQTVYGLKSRTYDKNDKQEAFKIAKQIAFEGLEQKEIAKVIREEKLTQAYRLIEQYEREIAIELAEHTPWLKAAVKALQHHKVLSVGVLKELRERA